jgi:demethoxyubiquinone hydroxylase (CLK1/Coq7/Cat5 family)
VIEGIVARELDEAARYFESRDPEVHDAIRTILVEEAAHQVAGEQHSPGSAPVDRVVAPAARAGASVSKGLAERL